MTRPLLVLQTPLSLQLAVNVHFTFVSRRGVETRGDAAKRQDNTSWGNSEVSLEPFLSRASRDNAQTVDDQAIVGAANTTTTTN